VHPGAALQRTIVWDDVTIDPGARLTDCIVADGARVPAGAAYTNCAIIGANDFVPADGERLADGLLVRAL
jgi:NDP-sugar pyrophosphorylase family protein